eukprot:10441219-Alexandrium_andersonii.AAC.1
MTWQEAPVWRRNRGLHSRSASPPRLLPTVSCAGTQQCFDSGGHLAYAGVRNLRRNTPQNRRAVFKQLRSFGVACSSNFGHANWLQAFQS